MTILEQITQEAGTLSLDFQQQVLNYIQHLKTTEQRALEEDIDAIITENLSAWNSLV